MCLTTITIQMITKKELPFRCCCGRYFWMSQRIKCSSALLFHYWPSQLEVPVHTIRFHFIPWYSEQFWTSTKVEPLPGVKLPKTENDWNIANDYLKLHLHHNSEITDINLTIRTFNQKVYNYFHNFCGPVN